MTLQTSPSPSKQDGKKDDEVMGNGFDYSGAIGSTTLTANRASDASFDIFKDLALNDEGIRGIHGAKRRKSPRLPSTRASRAETEGSPVVQQIKSAGGPLARIIASAQRRTRMADEKDDHSGEEGDSLLVNCSTRDSAYIDTSVEDVSYDPPIPYLTISATPYPQQVHQQSRTLPAYHSTSPIHDSPLSCKSHDLRDTQQPPISSPPRMPSPHSVPPEPATQPTIDRSTVPESSGRDRHSSPRHLDDRSLSRSRSTEAAPSIVSGVKCDDCEEICIGCSYCNGCDMIFCEACWDRVLPHRRKRTKASIPHERTNYQMARKVKQILASNVSEGVRERLHEDDIQTTWFGVFRQKGAFPMFREYGRYADLVSRLKLARSGFDPPASNAMHFDHQDEIIHPSLTSFVGETGAGKSTVIKLLIDLKLLEGEDYQTPVIGAAGHDVATSEDVHLYLDPESSRVGSLGAPILYADCEGLNGGERDPLGAKWRQKFERNLQDESGAESRRIPPRLKHVSQRPLMWANTDRRQSREFAVAHLYPRLLYTFSDVIVFVLKNPRVIESVLERLLSWAEAALEKSSNQPILPCAIIVLNASEYNIDEDWWDVDHATSRLVTSLSEVLRRNHDFKKYVEMWQKRGRQMETVEQLLWAYYASVRVVRIPAAGRPNLIQQQVQRLSKEIYNASSKAQERKRELRMLLDADGLAPYLQFAIDHFARSLDDPFDFVQASFTYSPIPMDFGGNILKLAVQVMNRYRDRATGSTIFEVIGHVVASCIMFNASRSKIKGPPARIFPRYLEHLDNALETFCDRYWPCEYTGLKGGRCVNVRSGHEKGHQLKSGKLLSAGDYKSDFSFQTYRKKFAADVYRTFADLTRAVQTRASSGMLEIQAATQVHKKALAPFFQSHQRSEPFVNHTVCLSCLEEAPQHGLPCGHTICTQCLTTFGRSQDDLVEMDGCPLESKERRFRPPWRVRLKPKNCGVRVLSLDGGGVRGFVQLEVLAELERQLGGGLNVRSFFDLIVGTGTGGFIALGLTDRGWNLPTCMERFEAFCNKSFTLRRGLTVPVVGKVIEIYNQSKYDERPLDDHLRETFAADRYLFGGQRGRSEDLGIKVAVTATSSTGKLVVLANYNHLYEQRLPYHFQRPQMPQQELKTWEVVRAACAAPRYFKPFSHHASHQVYSDAGPACNNPIKVALREQDLIWSGHRNESPDLTVSIGSAVEGLTKMRRTGRPSKPAKTVDLNGNTVLQKTRKAHVSHSNLDDQLPEEHPWRWLSDNVLERTASAIKHNDIVKLKKKNRDSTNLSDFEDVVWKDRTDHYCSDHDVARHVRVNYRLTGPIPRFDDIGGIPHLQREIRHLTQDDPKIRELAKQLVATCFYLDVDGNVAEVPFEDSELFEIRGYFRCRLTSRKDICGLGNFIHRCAAADHDPYFIVQNEHDPYYIARSNKIGDDQAREIVLTSITVDRMRNEGRFTLDEPLLVRSGNKSVQTRISLCYTRDASFPISKFPRCLYNDQPKKFVKRRAVPSRLSAHWVSRPQSQVERMRDWDLQNITETTKEGNVIEQLGAHTDEEDSESRYQRTRFEPHDTFDQKFAMSSDVRPSDEHPEYDPSILASIHELEDTQIYELPAVEWMTEGL